MQGALGWGIRLCFSAAVWRRGLVIEAVRLFFRTRPSRGLLPDQEFVAWRVATAYGSPDFDVPRQDLVDYLAWQRRQHRLTG